MPMKLLRIAPNIALTHISKIADFCVILVF